MQGLSQAREKKLILDEHKQKLDQEKDAFDIDMKIKKLQLQKLESDPDSDPDAISAKKELFMAESKLKKSAYEAANLQIAHALNQINKEGEQYATQVQEHGKIAQALGDYTFDLSRIGVLKNVGLRKNKPKENDDLFGNTTGSSEIPSTENPDVDSLKPDEVSQEDWDSASLEEKTEFLKAIGKINA
jgi:hypothetical protein